MLAKVSRPSLARATEVSENTTGSTLMPCATSTPSVVRLPKLAGIGEPPAGQVVVTYARSMADHDTGGLQAIALPLALATADQEVLT